MNFYTAAEGSRKFGVPIPEEAIFGGVEVSSVRKKGVCDKGSSDLLKPHNLEIQGVNPYWEPQGLNPYWDPQGLNPYSP